MADFLPLPDGVDPDALMDAWLGQAVEAQAEHDAEAEQQQMRRRLNRVQLEDRQKRAWQLASGGATIYQIADQLGIHPTRAYRDIQAYVRVNVPTTEREEARKLSVDRHLAMYRRLNVAFLQAAGEDQLKIADRLLKVMAAIDKLHQVDLPAPLDTPASELGTPGDVFEELHALRDRATDRLAAEQQMLHEAGLLSGPPPGHPG